MDFFEYTYFEQFLAIVKPIIMCFYLYDNYGQMCMDIGQFSTAWKSVEKIKVFLQIYMKHAIKVLNDKCFYITFTPLLAKKNSTAF